MSRWNPNRLPNTPEIAERVRLHMGIAWAAARDAWRKSPVRRGVDFGDVLSQATCALWRAAVGFDPSRGCQFTTLAWTACWRAARSAIFNEVNRVRSVRTVAMPRQLGTPSALQEVLRREQSRRVRRALEGLPERQRALLVGHYFEGRTLAELGRERGVSKMAASRAAARARQRMSRGMEAA